MNRRHATDGDGAPWFSLHQDGLWFCITSRAMAAVAYALLEALHTLATARGLGG